MFNLRMKTLSARDPHWRNSTKKIIEGEFQYAAGIEPLLPYCIDLRECTLHTVQCSQVHASIAEGHSHCSHLCENEEKCRFRAPAFWVIKVKVMHGSTLRLFQQLARLATQASALSEHRICSSFDSDSEFMKAQSFVDSKGVWITSDKKESLNSCADSSPHVQCRYMDISGIKITWYLQI